MATVDAFLLDVLEKRGSDLHFIAGDPPRIRQYGDLQALRPEKLAQDFVKDALYEIMPKPALERFESKDGLEEEDHFDHDRDRKEQDGAVRQPEEQSGHHRAVDGEEAHETGGRHHNHLVASCHHWSREPRWAG